MPDSNETVPYDTIYRDSQQKNTIEEEIKDQNQMEFDIEKDEETGMHFLVNKNESAVNGSCEEGSSDLNVRSEFLEYTMRSDGSVSCKGCGQIMASRTQWYRHKYRAHVMDPVNPAPLFQCEQCLIYFKSRKGYIGHISSKHSETLQDVSPVLTNAQAEALAKEKSIIQPKIHPPQDKPEESWPSPDPADIEVKQEPDPEQSIPKSVVPTYQIELPKTTSRATETTNRKTTRSTKLAIPRLQNVTNEQPNVDPEESEKKRRREEKLVADIIARVRRECEAQGSGGPARRGYSRKSGLHT